jgi:hypothetical protein
MSTARRVVAMCYLLVALSGCAMQDLPAASTAASRDPAAPGTAASHGPTWVPVPESPLSPRRAATAVWVDQQFLVVGGLADWCPPTADCAGGASPRVDGAVLDPRTGRWQSVADAPTGVAAAPSAVIDGVVYLLTSDAVARLLAYDAAADRWTSLPPPPGTPDRLVAAGEVLVAVSGSDELEAAVDSVFAPDTGAWTALPDDPLGPSFDREAVWLGHRLLLAAKDLVASPGSERPALVRLAELDATWTTWRGLPDSELLGWGATAVGDHVVWPVLGAADGGQVNGWGRAYPNGGVLDPADGTWRPLPDIPGGGNRGRVPAAVVGDRVVVGDGLLDPATLAWAPLPKPPWDDVAEQAVAGSDDLVLVWGGSDAAGLRADGHLLRP